MLFLTKIGLSIHIVVNFTQQTHACACVRMVQNNWKHPKISKKVPFSSCAQEAHEEKRKKKFGGQQFGATPKSWLTPKRWLLIWNCVVFVVFCAFFYMHLLCARWYSLKNFITHFRVFSIVFDHANACASMHSLDEIHNIYITFTLQSMVVRKLPKVTLVGECIPPNKAVCRDHCRCPAAFILLFFSKRGIFTLSPLLWVFKTLSFIWYHVDLPCLPY